MTDITPALWQQFTKICQDKTGREPNRGAIELKLAKICRDTGAKPHDIIKQSIRRNWASVYPLRGKQPGNRRPKADQTVYRDREGAKWEAKQGKHKKAAPEVVERELERLMGMLR